MTMTTNTLTADIDRLLTQLRHAAPDRRLEQLEPLVWSKIAARRVSSAATLRWEWRGAIAAAALVIGAASGSAAAARAPSEFAAFSTNGAFLPSTLLGLSE